MRIALLASIVVSSAALRGGSVAVARGPARAEQAVMTARLHDPVERDEFYKGNMAQYICDLHDAKTAFDFCGGMMFQLVLSDKLRSHLASVAKAGEQVTVHDKSINRMAKMPGYGRDAAADNLKVFHGREVRSVPDAAGGMGFALHLSLANGDDQEGWTPQELERYDGWGHDSGREWRKGEQYEREGFSTFRSKFGAKAFGLHHRFYWHLDGQNRLWLSAEDGCEGVVPLTPGGEPAPGILRSLFGASA